MTRALGDISNTGADILFKSTLTSAASITDVVGATGSIVGSPTFDSILGMNTFAGSALFEDIVGNAALDTEGQIVVTVTTVGVAQRDIGTTGAVPGCSGSEGADRSGGSTLWASGDGSTATQARCRMSGSEIISARTASVDAEISEQVTTLSKPKVVKVCFSWTATTMRLFVDGVIIDSGARVGNPGDFLDLAIGAARSGTESFNRDDVDLFISNIVVSNRPVALRANPFTSLGLFGDSFAAQALAANGFPRLDGILSIAVTKFFVDAGFEPPATITGLGFAGYSLCDAVGSMGNLETEFANFEAQGNDLVFGLFGNNDISSATDAEAADPTTGTKTRGEEFLATITSATRVIIFDVGSVDNDTNFPQPAVNNRRDSIVNPALKSLESDSRVTVIDSSALLGFGSVNTNYQGYWNEIANDGSGPTGRDTGGAAPSVPQTDRHLSGGAGYPLCGAAVTAIFDEGDPVLNTLYTSLIFDLGQSGSIDFATNWSGETEFKITELPTWMEQDYTTGTVNFANATWGGQNSENTVGSGVWNIKVQAIDITGNQTTSTSIWVHVRT